MKKNLLLSLLVLFVLSTAVFAGVTDPKKDSDKIPAKNAKENKLSDEEISRLNRRVEGKYNMDNSTVSSTNTLKKNANANQVYVESGRRHHGGYIWVGGGGLLLLIILIIILV